MNNKLLYRLLFISAILDLTTGVMSIAINHLAMQIVALVFTSITLVLSIIYCIESRRVDNSKKNIGTVLIGSLDFATSLVSVLIMVLTTQILAIVASGFTFIKSLKIFVQSEKARKLFTQSKSILAHVAKKVAPVWLATLTSRINIYIKNLNNKEHIVKMKEFFKKFVAVVKANIGTISVVAIESLSAGGGAYALCKWLVGTHALPTAWAYVVAVACVALALAGVIALTIWIGKDSIMSAKVRTLLAILVKLVKKLFKNKEDADKAEAIFENVVKNVELMVESVQDEVDKQDAAEKAEAERIKAEKEAEKQREAEKKEAERLAKERERQAVEAQKAEEKRQAELLAKAKKLLAEREAEAEKLAEKQRLEAEQEKIRAEQEAEARRVAEEQAKEQAALNAIVEQLLKEKQAQAKAPASVEEAPKQTKQAGATASNNSLKKILK